MVTPLTPSTPPDNPNENEMIGPYPHQKLNKWDYIATIPGVGNVTSVVRTAINFGKYIKCKDNANYAKNNLKATVNNLKKGAIEIIPLVGTGFAIYVLCKDKNQHSTDQIVEIAPSPDANEIEGAEQRERRNLLEVIHETPSNSPLGEKSLSTSICSDSFDIDAPSSYAHPINSDFFNYRDLSEQAFELAAFIDSIAIPDSVALSSSLKEASFVLKEYANEVEPNTKIKADVGKVLEGLISITSSDAEAYRGVIDSIKDCLNKIDHECS